MSRSKGSASDNAFAIDGHDNTSLTKRRRDATVYDAVAGRVSTQRFIPDVPYTSTTRDTATSSCLPTPPDEVLFRRAGAPVRYEEDDIYWADRHLRKDQVLPDSDLLKAVHIYTSEYYSKALGTQGDVSFESMEETALLAVGMLLEEAAEHILGETGDMVFVEGEEISKPEGETTIQGLGLADSVQDQEEQQGSSANERKRKRRRKNRKSRREDE